MPATSVPIDKNHPKKPQSLSSLRGVLKTNSSDKELLNGYLSSKYAMIPNIIEYVICCIGAFAERFSLTNAEAYKYLHMHRGLDFLFKHYDTEHTQSIDDAVEDITAICLRHGGALA